MCTCVALLLEQSGSINFPLISSHPNAGLIHPWCTSIIASRKTANKEVSIDPSATVEMQKVRLKNHACLIPKIRRVSDIIYR